jgi:hypothetical protein
MPWLTGFPKFRFVLDFLPRKQNNLEKYQYQYLLTNPGDKSWQQLFGTTAKYG